MWWQGGREGGGGGNSPAHLLSFSARFYPAEFLWQPLKKRCAVNCGFEMRCLIALCGGDGWLFRQPSSVRGNWWRAPMKQHSICFIWCVCQSLVLQHVCVWGCACVYVCTLMEALRQNLVPPAELLVTLGTYQTALSSPNETVWLTMQTHQYALGFS